MCTTSQKCLHTYARSDSHAQCVSLCAPRVLLSLWLRSYLGTQPFLLIHHGSKSETISSLFRKRTPKAGDFLQHNGRPSLTAFFQVFCFNASGKRVGREQISADVGSGFALYKAALFVHRHDLRPWKRNPLFGLLAAEMAVL